MDCKKKIFNTAYLVDRGLISPTEGVERVVDAVKGCNDTRAYELALWYCEMVFDALESDRKFSIGDEQFIRD